MQGFLPEPGNEQWGKGQMLITTQDSSCIPLDSSFISHISVSKGMDPSDAACLLAIVSGIKNPDMEDKVAKALDYQPLALASAATYFKQVRKLSPSFEWKDYLEKLEQGKRALTENKLVKTNPHYSYSMTAATRIAVERAMNSNQIMKHAFTFLALCAPQLLKLGILTNYILSRGEDQDKEEICSQILGSSLILAEKEEVCVYIRLHQVVHDIVKLVVKDFIKAEEQARAVDIAVRSFNQFVETMPGSWTNINSTSENTHFVPHLKTLAVEIESVFSTERKCQFFSNSIEEVDVLSYQLQLRRLGDICRRHSELFSAKGYYSAAMKLIERSERYKRVLSIQLSKLGSEHIEVANTLHNLGIVHRHLGNHQQAKEHYERALSIKMNKLGPEHIDVANTLHNLGIVHRHLGNYQPAKEQYERALSIKLNKLGPEHIDIANTLHNLGIVHSHMGNHQQAKEHYERALSIKLKKRGPEHIDVANTLHNLGIVHSDMGNHQQAKEHYERALSIKLEKLGREHIDVANTLHNLGNVHRHMGNPQQAKEHYERALAIQLNKLGPEHIDVANTLHDLGIIQRHRMGNHQQAKEH